MPVAVAVALDVIVAVAVPVVVVEGELLAEPIAELVPIAEAEDVCEAAAD